MGSKFVIYTSIVGGYDKLPCYPCQDSDFDYICFTNDYAEGSTIGHWKVKNIPVKITDAVRHSRFPKMNPHLLLPEYECSVWIDGNISISTPDVYADIKKKIKEGALWSGIVHPDRDCVYEEIKFCLSKGKDKALDLIRSGLFLKRRNVVKHSGLYENNFIIRKHNDASVIKIDTEWWALYNKLCLRDQICLPYLLTLYKFRISPFLLPPLNVANDSRFSYIAHPTKSNTKSSFFKFKTNLILYTIALFKLF